MASTTKSRGTMLISEVPSPTMAMGTVRLNLRQYDHCEYGPSYFCVSPVRLWRAQVYYCVSQSRSSRGPQRGSLPNATCQDGASRLETRHPTVKSHLYGTAEEATAPLWRIWQ